MPSPLYIPLSPREKDVLTLAAEGVDRQEAAEILGVALSTVKKQHEHIKSKLGATNISHAVAIGCLYGFIQPNLEG